MVSHGGLSLPQTLSPERLFHWDLAFKRGTTDALIDLQP